MQTWMLGFLRILYSVYCSINVEDLISKLNAIEKDLNNLKKAFASWVPVSQDGGAALKVLLAQYSGKLFSETKRSEIEDTKVTH